MLNLTHHMRDFTTFVRDVEPRLNRALVAAYGIDVGREAARDALAYAWEHWDRVSAMKNPAGYLFRVGQSKSRQYRRRQPLFPVVDTNELPLVEPGLPEALGTLTMNQRIAVVLIHVLELSERESAAILGVSRASIRKHADRGLSKLRREIGD